jgi:hypothetical protein
LHIKTHFFLNGVNLLFGFIATIPTYETPITINRISNTRMSKQDFLALSGVSAGAGVDWWRSKRLERT